ncbi:uncharacterized protein [Arachis hypogaea]|uniref:uncharacterized protein n=1 Tax=Arachis hypogaea TaxID=3818 RepID=UPI0011057406|nr:uncharacterized protein LOC112786932 [Arachis hypogaea]
MDIDNLPWRVVVGDIIHLEVENLHTLEVVYLGHSMGKVVLGSIEVGMVVVLYVAHKARKVLPSIILLLGLRFHPICLRFASLSLFVHLRSTSPRAFSHRCCSYRNTTPPSLAPPPFLHVDAQDHRRRLGLWLLSQVEPSEIFLKSISNEVTSVKVIYPSSLNAQLVRRRLGHIALRGTIIHRKYLYATVSLIPFFSTLMVLPFPNITFFWVSFRAYSHWRALQDM